MERSSQAVASGPHRCHFSQGKTNPRVCHAKNFHPCAGKTRRAERGLIVVVRFACVACNIFVTHFLFFHKFSPNPLKRITLENPSVLLANTICVFVQDLSSKTVFLGVNGQCAIFDNYASRLSKTTHFALQRLFESLFWTTHFSDTGANHIAKCMILPKLARNITVTENQNS